MVRSSMLLFSQIVYRTLLQIEKLRILWLGRYVQAGERDIYVSIMTLQVLLCLYLYLVSRPKLRGLTEMEASSKSKAAQKSKSTYILRTKITSSWLLWFTEELVQKWPIQCSCFTILKCFVELDFSTWSEFSRNYRLHLQNDKFWLSQ